MPRWIIMDSLQIHQGAARGWSEKRMHPIRSIYGKSRLSSISLSASMTLPSPTSATLWIHLFHLKQNPGGDFRVCGFDDEWSVWLPSLFWQLGLADSKIQKIQTMIWLIEISYIVGSSSASKRCCSRQRFCFCTETRKVWREQVVDFLYT